MYMFMFHVYVYVLVHFGHKMMRYVHRPFVVVCFAAKLIGRLEIDPNADLAQVRSDIDHLIEVSQTCLLVLSVC